MIEERILVLLTDPNLVSKVVKILTVEGHRVKGIEAKEDLLALIENEVADMIIADWMVGDLPGVKVFKRIQEWVPWVRAIFVTEHGGREIMSDALAEGAAGVLIRPFSPQALLETVRHALKREPERILVIDDDPAVGEMCVDALRQDGYEVESVRSGEAAIRRILNGAFDLALVDWQMPGLDGVETFRALREIQQDLDAVMITGHGTPAVLSQVLKEGMAGFLIKPFTIQALSTTIGKVLRRRWERRSFKSQGSSASLAGLREGPGRTPPATT